MKKIKCQYCGFRFPSLWLKAGGAVKDERGHFCSVRCQQNANGEAYGVRCVFCSQPVKTPFISDCNVFCSSRHATMWKMIQQHNKSPHCD